MKYIKRFFEHKESIYEADWRKLAPEKLVVIKGDSTDMAGHILDSKTNEKCEFLKRNIMKDLVFQLPYEANFSPVPGIPDTLELDIAIIDDVSDGNSHMNVEITFGDLIVSGFTIISPNEIHVYQYTSNGSKTDKSDTVFAFDEESIISLMTFFNKFDGFELTREKFNFLDSDPHSYIPD
jgi:hypothetical protein